MSLNAEEEDDGFGGDISHALLIRRDGDASASSTQQSSLGETTTSLILAQGENWLRLVVSLDTNAVLLDTQETTMTKPFPSISSLNEMGSTDAPTPDCYICIDVDGPYVAIKDMRPHISSQETDASEDDEMFEVFLARRKPRHEKLAALVDSQASDDDGAQYYALESLERRQLRFLNKGDRIVTRSCTGGDADGLVLEYVQRKGEPRERRGGEEEMTQESTSLEIVEEHANTAASGGTEASKPSDTFQTQPEGLTPKSAGEDEYKTAVEQPTQESGDETDSSFYDGEGEATQAFPRPSAESPERARESDDAASMDVNPPESEKDQTFFTPANDIGRQKESAAGPDTQEKDENADFVMGTQPQEDDEEAAGETDDPMDQSTQAIPKSTPSSVREETTNGDIGTSAMSPIAEGSEAQASLEDRVVDGKLDEQPSQASSTLEDSKKEADPKETDSDISDTQEEQVGEDETDEDSNSDALVDSDEEAVKDDSAEVSVKPQKQLGETRAVDTNANETIVAAKTGEKDDDHLPIAAGEEPLKSGAAAPVADEQMSDSSSVTELEDAPRQNRNKKDSAMEGSVQKDVAVPDTGDDASRTSSITEADDMVSPRKGLVTISRKENDTEASSDQARQQGTTDKPPGDMDGAEDIVFAEDTKAGGGETTTKSNQEDHVDKDSNQADDNDDDDETVLDDESSVQAKDVTAAQDVEKVSGQADDDDDETVADEPSDQAMADTAAKDMETRKTPSQEAHGEKVTGQVDEDDDDETVGDETEEVDATAHNVRIAESSGQKNEVPVQEPVVAEHVEDPDASRKEEIAEASGPEGDGEKDTNGAEIVTEQPNREKSPPVQEVESEEVKRDEGSSEDKSKEPVVEPNGAEDAAVAEATGRADKEVHASEEASDESQDHDAFPHSAETAVTDNRSPSVDRHDAPSEKEEAVERPLVTDAKDAMEEAKGVEEAESAEARSKPTVDQADAVEMSASGENDETDTTIADGQAEKPTAEPPKKRKVPAFSSRSTRRKASPPPEPENEQEKEETLETPAQKRSTRRKATSAQPKEEEPENDETHKTPAKKRARADYPLRGSARKRTRGAATSSPGDEPIRVLMTGVGESEKHKKLVGSIGAELIEKIEDAHTATHVIAGDDKTSLRRTPKLMIGMCQTSKIIHMDWLTKSAKAREPLACNDFLLLKDRKAEKLYGFVMRKALQRGDELRRNNEFLLTGHWVYVCKGVAGNKAPPEKELELIVDAAGATWLSSISARTMKGVDASKLIIIAPESPSKKKTKTAEAKDVERAIKNGASSHPASWLFQCIIRQSLDD